MSYCSDIVVGDLVCIKSRSDDKEAGWIAIEVDVGIVIEIIEFESHFELYGYKMRCYDYVIYWVSTTSVETLPDIVIEKYSDHLGRYNEGLR